MTSTVRPNTLKTYDSSMRVLASLYGSRVVLPRVHSWLDLDRFEEVTKSKSKATRKLYLSAIKHYAKLDDSPDDFLNKLDELHKSYFDYKPAKKTVKEYGLPTLHDMRGLYDSVKSQWTKTPKNMNLFIYTVYLYPFHDKRFPVLRNDLATIRIGHTMNGNFYDGHIIYLLEHKSSGKIGPKALNVPDELRDIINTWISENDLKLGDYLLMGKPPQEISRVLGLKKLGTRALRLWYNELYTGEKRRKRDRIDKELETFDGNMLHTRKVADHYYTFE